MRSTGIVRKIDSLGRVVIPKKVRDAFNIRARDEVEIFVHPENGLILKKYSSIEAARSFALQYTDALHEATGHIALICTRDSVVAATGNSTRTWIDQEVPEQIIDSAEEMEDEDSSLLSLEDEYWNQSPWVAAPIMVDGSMMGFVLLGTGTMQTKMGTTERKLAETAARFFCQVRESLVARTVVWSSE